MKVRFFLMALVAAFAMWMPQRSHASVYTWSQYNLTFETPDNGFVTGNTSTYFEIQWEDMVMTIRLYKRQDSDDKKTFTTNLERKASGYNMYDTKSAKVKVKGFNTYALDGTMPDGSRAIICDLVSKKKESRLIVEVTINYLLGNRDTVEDIIKSFAENKTQQPNKREKAKQKVQSKEDAEKQEKELEREQQEREKEQRRKNAKTYEV